MTMTEPAVDLAGGLAVAAGAASAAILVDPMLVPGAPGSALPALPGGSKTVVADLVGPRGGGRLALTASPELVEALEEGPLGAQDLLDAAQPVLVAVAAALEVELGGPLALEAPQVVSGPTAVGELVVPLLAAGEAVAALSLEWEADAAAPAAAPVELPPLVEERPAGAVTAAPLELLHEVEMSVTAELGRTRMTVRNLLSLTPGAIVELDRAAGAPVDLLVNGTLIARGEVVVVDDEYGIRVTEIVRRERPAR